MQAPKGESEAKLDFHGRLLVRWKLIFHGLRERRIQQLRRLQHQYIEQHQRQHERKHQH